MRPLMKVGVLLGRRPIGVTLKSQQELALPPRPGPYEAVPQLYAAGPPSSVTLRFLRGHCAVLTRELHHQQAYNQFNSPHVP